MDTKGRSRRVTKVFVIERFRISSGDSWSSSNHNFASYYSNLIHLYSISNCRTLQSFICWSQAPAKKVWSCWGTSKCPAERRRLLEDGGELPLWMKELIEFWGCVINAHWTRKKKRDTRAVLWTTGIVNALNEVARYSYTPARTHRQNSDEKKSFDLPKIQSKNCSISRKMGASVLNWYCLPQSFPIRTGSFFPSKR